MPMTFDQATVDGTGAFLVHELERLDQTLNLPLVNFTWSRDIQLRPLRRNAAEARFRVR